MTLVIKLGKKQDPPEKVKKWAKIRPKRENRKIDNFDQKMTNTCSKKYFANTIRVFAVEGSPF